MLDHNPTDFPLAHLFHCGFQVIEVRIAKLSKSLKKRKKMSVTVVSLRGIPALLDSNSGSN